MLLNALTNYLQNQPATTDVAAGAAQAPSAADPVKEKDPAADSGPSLYEVSDRAVMVSAVAADFDVTALKAGELGSFQSRLQEFGLLQGAGLNALGMVHTARAGLSDSDTINAMALIDDARSTAVSEGASYTRKQQINQLHTLFSNLASARPH
jgi:hypothetical protein